MKNTECLLLTIAHPLRSLLARRSCGRIPRTDEAEPLRLAAAGGRDLAVRYWAPREEGGVWFGAEDASAAVDLPPLPEGADPAAPREVALRAVFRPDRVEAFVGDAPAPALVFATDRYAPAAFPDGAKLLFFGKGASFHGFTFRKPHAEAAEPGSPAGGAGERSEPEGGAHTEGAEP